MTCFLNIATQVAVLKSVLSKAPGLRDTEQKSCYKMPLDPEATKMGVRRLI